MKEHVEAITDLLLGAAFADKRLEGVEVNTIQKLLCKLMGTETIPAAQADQMSRFNPARFEVEQRCAGLSDLAASQRMEVLRMVAAVNDADEELDMAEDNYLRKVAKALELPEDAYDTLTIEVEELDGALAD